MKNNHFIIFIFCISCVESLDIALPKHEIRPVLNGLINPDSTIKINLTKSSPLGSQSSFEPIKDAQLTIFEDSELIGNLDYSGEGNYELDYYPKASCKYRVVADIPNYGTLEAEDEIPLQPNAEILKINHYNIVNGVSQSNNQIGFFISLEDDISEEAYYWIGSHDQGYNDYYWDEELSKFVKAKDSLDYTYHSFLYTTDPPTFVDRFNSSFSELDNAYQFRFYIRFSDKAFNGNTTTFSYWTFHDIDVYEEADFDKLEEEEGIFIHIINGSKNYDRYMKSSLIHHLNFRQNDVPDPFAAPVRIYDNVQNGLGVFAAYNSITLRAGHNE